MKRIALIVAAFSAALALGSCRDQEQGRPLHYTANYAGRPDSPLSPKSEQALHDRVRFQVGLDAGSPFGPGAGLATSGDVRPPTAAEERPDVRPPATR